MKFVIAIDSFKGSMTSIEAGDAVKRGILRCFPDSENIVLPVADGGEGTVEALVAGLGGTIKVVTVSNPLMKKIKAQYGMIGSTAVMEMAAAAGIALLDKSELNPMNTTTYGVGEMIKDAIASGCREFIIGIGGSATNDGGTGMLHALGFSFLDADGNPIPYGAKGLSNIKVIRDEDALPELKECTFHIACDVTNPLCGELGCSEIFAPQKGASLEDVKVMDAAMKNYAEVTMTKYKTASPEYPGAGAAGLGFAFMAYLGGKLTSGVDLILSKINIEQYIKDADLVITGEGKMDGQSFMGKAPVGIAKIAKKYGKGVIAFAGSVAKEANTCNAHGIDAVFPILRGVCTLEEAMDNDTARQNIADTVEQVMRVLRLNGGMS